MLYFICGAVGARPQMGVREGESKCGLVLFHFYPPFEGLLACGMGTPCQRALRFVCVEIEISPLYGRDISCIVVSQQFFSTSFAGFCRVQC